MTVTLLCIASLLSPQDPPKVEITAGQRQLTQATFQSGPRLTRVEVAYGVPEWRADFAQVLQRKGPLQLRLGRDAWTTLTTTAPLTFGDVRVPAGIWVLALRRAADGDWGLLFANAQSVTVLGQHPARTRDVAADFIVPMRFATAEAQPRLQIELAAPAASSAGAHAVPLRLALHWHEYRLTTDLSVALPPPLPVAPPFSRVEGGGAVIERPGLGTVPRDDADRDHVVLFTLWDKAGRLLDSCHARGDPQIAKPTRFQADWQEQLRRIGPGGRVRFETDRHVVVLDLLELR